MQALNRAITLRFGRPAAAAAAAADDDDDEAAAAERLRDVVGGGSRGPRERAPRELIVRRGKAVGGAGFRRCEVLVGGGGERMWHGRPSGRRREKRAGDGSYVRMSRARIHIHAAGRRAEEVFAARPGAIRARGARDSDVQETRASAGITGSSPLSRCARRVTRMQTGGRFRHCRGGFRREASGVRALLLYCNSNPQELL